MLIAKINVKLAYLFGNRGGKRKDVNGRKYRAVYKEFGFKAMLDDYLHGNSWYIKKRVGLI